MSRIAIITLTDFNNYGNRLQNYALERVLIEMGNTVDSIVPYRPNIIKETVKTVIRKKDKNLKQKWLQLKRLKNFMSFDKKYVHTYAINNNNYCAVPTENYDCFISGSDQVWNPDWAGYTYDKVFLRFCTSDRRISYAASFGVDEIPDKWKEKYVIGLSEFHYLSVREKNAVEIVKSLTGKTCEKVLDPTMLLDRYMWDEIKKMPKKVQGKNYILTYFLGEKTHTVNERLTKYAQRYQCDVINLLDINLDEYVVAPDEFIGLVSNAKLIMTDSFHATVFSILYEKPFVVYSRNGIGSKMGSRISSLLEICGLSERRSESIDDENLLECDFETARKAIEQEKMHSLEFLRKSIAGCGDSAEEV